MKTKEKNKKSTPLEQNLRKDYHYSMTAKKNYFKYYYKLWTIWKLFSVNMTATTSNYIIVKVLFSEQPKQKMQRLPSISIQNLTRTNVPNCVVNLLSSALKQKIYLNWTANHTKICSNPSDVRIRRNLSTRDEKEGLKGPQMDEDNPYTTKGMTAKEEARIMHPSAKNLIFSKRLLKPWLLPQA